MEQPQWLLRAKETHSFHRTHLISDKRWTLQKTAKSLKRSLGSICEDILLSKWTKTHEKQLEKFEYAYEALEFIRKRQRELDLE